MERACSTHGEKRNTAFRPECGKERTHLAVLGTNGRLILKIILYKLGGRGWIISICFREGKTDRFL
jgi:hypothetical protein